MKDYGGVYEQFYDKAVSELDACEEDSEELKRIIANTRPLPRKKRKAFVLHASDGDPINTMSIECSDETDLANYAAECIKQGYTHVEAIVEEN
jgi:hypothetical protein